MSRNFVNPKYRAMFDITTPLGQAIEQTPEHLRAGVIEAEMELADIREYSQRMTANVE